MKFTYFPRFYVLLRMDFGNSRLEMLAGAVAEENHRSSMLMFHLQI